MVRRVSHQLHDLTARAVVAEEVTDLAEYGLGDGSIEVTLTMRDGRIVAFQAGDPNPTSVSWYIRPIPGNSVYVVKKSAVDYYRLSLESFREKKIAALDANDAERIDAMVDGREVAVHRVRPKVWRMSAPVEQSADRQEVRTMLGRVGALKALEFVADEPSDLTEWGIESSSDRIQITLVGGETITLQVGDTIPATEPVQGYVYLKEDDAVYKVKMGFLEAYTKAPKAYRRRRVMEYREWKFKSIEASLGDETLEIVSTSGGWRWADDAPISGSTPRRLANSAVDLRAVEFDDDATDPGKYGLDSPFGVVKLIGAGDTRTITLGDSAEVEHADNEVERRQWIQVDGDPVVYQVHWGLGGTLEDLFREHGRKAERDQEKRLLDETEADVGEHND